MWAHRGQTPERQEIVLTGGIELQNGRAELEVLRPLRPALGNVLAVPSEDGCSLPGAAVVLDGPNLLRRTLPETIKLAGEVGELE